MRKVISILLIILGVGLFILFNFTPLYHITLEKLGIIDNIETDLPEKENGTYDGINNSYYKGFYVKGFEENEFSIENGLIDVSKEYGLKSYTINNKSFEYIETFNSNYISSVLYDESIIYTEVYYEEDMYLDTVIMGNNILEYIYENDKLVGIMINESYLYYKENGNITTYYLDDKLLKSSTYTNGKIMREVIDNYTLDYEYINDALISNNQYFTTAKDYSITVEKDECKTIFTYGYVYGGHRYVNKIVNDDGIFEISYLNDKILSVKKDNEVVIEYILDKNLKHIGYIVEDVVFYYVYDLNGTVLAVIDNSGNVVENYQTSCNGEIFSSKSESENNIVIPGYYYDGSSGLLCGADVLINPFDNTIVNITGNVFPISCDYMHELINNLEHLEYVLAMNVFKDMVQTEVLNKLSNNGIVIASNVECINKESKYAGSIDLYCLDSSVTESSFGNLLYGNQAYLIAYNDFDNQEEVRQVQCFADKFDKLRALFYTKTFDDSFEIKKGVLEFAGQFIFMEYLITYSCDGNGIIYYSFNSDKVDNYQTYFNIYNYDKSYYVNYTEKTFNVETDFKDVTTIIPGLNQEIYDIVSNYIKEVEIIGAQVVQHELRYYDDTYLNVLNSSLQGDTLDASIFADISEDDMIVLAENGDLVVKALPFYNNPKFIRNTLATGVLVVGLGVISFVVPGGQCCIPVFCAVVKGAATTFVSSLVANLTIYTLNNMNEDDFFANLPEFMNKAMVDISYDVLNASIFSAVVSEISVFKSLKQNKSSEYIGKSLRIREVTADEVLDQFDMSYMWDLPNAQAEYEKYKELAKIPGTVVAGNEPTVVRRLIKLYDDNVLLAKYLMKVSTMKEKIEWEELL